MVLDTDKIDTALSLGVTPVGAATRRRGRPAGRPTSARTRSPASRRSACSPSPTWRRSAPCKPDLILGSKFRQEKFYDELSAIAPTVFTEQVGITWKENFLLDGQALGKEQQAKDLLAAYEKRAKDLGAKIGDAAERKVSIVRFMPDRDPGVRAGVVLRHRARRHRAGPPRAAAAGRQGGQAVRQGQPRADRRGRRRRHLRDRVRREGRRRADQGDRRARLWKNLGAVKAGKAYVVADETWMTGIGVTAAGKILDDLEKYLPAA